MKGGILASVVALWGLTAGKAEIIDRIAISIANQVITQDQVLEEVRVTAFLNHAKLTINSEEKKKAAERLIEQMLVKREMDFSRYPSPKMADADQRLSEVKAAFGDDPKYLQALKDYGISEEDLRRHLLWQMTLLRFIDYRFRPGIQISDGDLKTYYDKQVAEWKEQNAVHVPTLEESREKIEATLTEERVDQALDAWLVDARTQVDLRYHSGALE